MKKKVWEVYHKLTLRRTCTGCYSVIPLSRVDTRDRLDCFSVRHEQATVTCYCDDRSIGHVFWTRIIPGPRPGQRAAVQNWKRNSLYLTLSAWKLWNFSVLKWIQKTRKWWTHTFAFSGIFLPVVDTCCFPTRHGFGFGVIAQDEAYVTLIAEQGGDGGVLVSVG